MRPDWEKVYLNAVHKPDRDDELIAVTRETLRLAASAIRSSQEQDAYNNFAAAEQEILWALDPHAANARNQRDLAATPNPTQDQQ